MASPTNPPTAVSGKVRRIFLAVGAATLALLAADYAYFKGFDNGADTSLCVIALQVDGPEIALESRSYRNIKGLTLPPRIFPGRNGDEPTIWQKDTPHNG